MQVQNDVQVSCLGVAIENANAYPECDEGFLGSHDIIGCMRSLFGLFGVRFFDTFIRQLTQEVFFPASRKHQVCISIGSGHRLCVRGLLGSAGFGSGRGGGQDIQRDRLLAFSLSYLPKIDS